jgi:hypothetical protein
MLKTKEAATEFLDHKRVAVTGVSRHPANHGSNVVYTRLRERGYQVFPVNPNADEVEGHAEHDRTNAAALRLEPAGSRPQAAGGCSQAPKAASWPGTPR